MTTVSARAKIKNVEKLLSDIRGIDKWNFDIEACDNILGIEQTTLTLKILLIETLNPYDK
jgi:hypothetical protein